MASDTKMELSFWERFTDRALSRTLAQAHWKGEYDLVGGLVGFGTYALERANASALAAHVIARLDEVKETTLAGEEITSKLTRAPGNDAAIGGLKVTAANGWFAARPSGTENIYKIYAESFKDQAHLDAIVSEAQEIVSNALKSSVAGA